MKQALAADIRRSSKIRLTSAYFLPPGRVRRAIIAAARRGAEVQVLVPGISDVRVAQWAAWGQYGRLLRAGVEIFEYEPAILHTKCYVMDDIAYIGSANLDVRSLSINYELLVRVQDADFAAEGHAIFKDDLQRSRRVSPEEWRRRPWWNKLIERLASALLERLDLGIAMRQFARLRGGVVSARLRRRHSLR